MASISGDFSTNLVSHWTLDETSGTRMDSTANNNDLTDNNTVLNGTGKQGNCADFELTNSEYLSIADGSQTGLDITGNLTFSAWVNFESYSSGSIITFMSKLNFGDGGTLRSYAFTMNITGANKLDFYAGNGTTAGSVGVSWTPTTATWYHIAVVYTASGGTADFYVDGTQQGTQQSGLVTSILNGSRPFQLAMSFDGVTPSYLFDGLMDEVSIWSTTLTSGNISTIYNGGTGIPYSAGGGSAAPTMMLMGMGT